MGFTNGGGCGIIKEKSEERREKRIGKSGAVCGFSISGSYRRKRYVPH